jgi:hypothetical protein
LDAGERTVAYQRVAVGYATVCLASKSVVFESMLTAGLAALAAGVFWLLGWRLRRAY